MGSPFDFPIQIKPLAIELAGQQSNTHHDESISSRSAGEKGYLGVLHKHVCEEDQSYK
jgi:hypothetical protein